MEKSKILMMFFIAILLLSLLFTNTKVFATETDNQVTEENTESEITEEETSGDTEMIYEGDLYVLFSEDDYSETTYVMDKYVDGNVFIFGQDVKITGQVNGSLFVFASSLEIAENAYIACHVFAYASDITMSGYTTDMYVACNNFEMTSTGVIYRDLKLGTENAILYGQVGRDVDLSADNITVYKDDDTQLFVAEDFNYSSANEIADIDKITVNGEVTFTETQEDTSNDNVVQEHIYKATTNAVFTLAVYALIIFLAPKFTQKSKEFVSTRSLIAAAVGLGFLVLVPIIAFILIFTIIGIPVSIAIIVLYALILMIGNTVVTGTINEFIVDKVPALNNIWKKILLIIPVSIVVYLVKQIPVIGGWFGFILILIGIGIVVLYQFDKRKKETDVV